MTEGINKVVEHVHQMELLAKDLSDAGHPLSNKIQVTTIANSVPNSWDHVMTTIAKIHVYISMDIYIACTSST